MRNVHAIKLTVFAKESENSIDIAQTLANIIPFDLADEKIILNKEVAEGANGSKIIIFSINLSKIRHINKFLENLNEELGGKQKKLLIQQVESRLDQDLHFFIRLDKSLLLTKKEYHITDSGNCFHIRLAIAAYPKKRNNGIDIIKQIFS